MQVRNAFVITMGLFASVVSFAGPVVPGFDSNAIEGGTYYSNSGAVDIGFPLYFYGNEYSQLWVNAKGTVTLNGAGSGSGPGRMDTSVQTVLSPFYGSVDTRYAGSPVTYGVGTYDGQAAFGVNWVDISYIGNGSVGPGGSIRFADPDDIYSARNSYQLIIVDRSNGDFDFIFNYDSIQWQESVHIGWSNGRKSGQSSAVEGTFFEFPAGQGVPYDANLHNNLYSTGAFLDGGSHALAGQSFTFQVRNGIVSSPIITTTIPEPETWAMLLAGLGIMGSVAAKRRRRQG